MVAIKSETGIIIEIVNSKPLRSNIEDVLSSQQETGTVDSIGGLLNTVRNPNVQGYLEIGTNLMSKSTKSIIKASESTVLYTNFGQQNLSTYGDAVSRGTADIGGNIRVFHIPAIKWPDRANPILTNRVCEMLETLWAIVVSRAFQLGFPLRETTVSVFIDPTENRSKAILRLTCQTNIAQALSFWDSLEPDLQNWLSKLSESDRTTFLTKISMRIYWR